jgi:deazaflavin-dependent oxidoreductase (nitroreductase family)
MAEHFLYLTTIGRTTGQRRQIEIWFVEHAGRHYIVSERRTESQWVKNIQRSPQVEYCVGSRAAPAAAVPHAPARARLLDDAAEPALASTVKALMDAKYGWSDGLIVELSRAPAA